MNVNTKQQIKIDVITKYLSGKIYYKDALEILGIKERQFRRIVKAFKESGVKSLVHRNKGCVPANKTSEFVRYQIVSLYSRQYRGLNVVHFMEKLKDHDIKLPSYSTVRSILLEAKLISPQIKKRKRPHARRHRYEKEGLMIQIDGSHHRWIFGQKPICLTIANPNP